MRTKAPGDSKEMVAARRAFLNAGYYGIFGQALGELLSLIHIYRRQLGRAGRDHPDR